MNEWKFHHSYHFFIILIIDFYLSLHKVTHPQTGCVLGLAVSDFAVLLAIAKVDCTSKRHKEQQLEPYHTRHQDHLEEDRQALQRAEAKASKAS